jgi:hypothetical protein
MGWDELSLPNAIRPDDALDLEGTVLEKRESKSKPGRGILRNQVHLRNQTGDGVAVHQQCSGCEATGCERIDVSRSIDAVGWFSLQCLLWVNRVTLTARRSLPVFPCKRTSSGPVAMSQKCHIQTSR